MRKVRSASSAGSLVTVSLWGKDWSTYCSVAEMDEGLPIPKFCSRLCREKGGEDAQNVTEAMKRTARDLEWREPRIVYREREMNEREKWQEAVRVQKRQHERKVALNGGEKQFAVFAGETYYPKNGETGGWHDFADSFDTKGCL